VKTIVYLHGFMGSSRSKKATQAQRWFADNLPQQNIWVPDLPYSPREAISLVKKAIGDTQAVFIGSSLGGFYANHFSEQLGTKAVLVNPAVRPDLLLHNYLGHQKNPYSGETFELTQTHIDELKELLVDPITRPNLRRVLLQTGDETLDYREAKQYYQHSELIVEQGGDHSFINFEKHLPDIAKFLLK
jgi:predicted esterase YcpF (UPF0227 family)